jgi:hypothetical protein
MLLFFGAEGFDLAVGCLEVVGVLIPPTTTVPLPRPLPLLPFLQPPTATVGVYPPLVVLRLLFLDVLPIPTILLL